MPNDTDLAWLAGFFDGEGCIRFCKRKTSWMLRIILANTHYASIKRAHAILGVGTVTRRDHKNDKWQPLFLLDLSAKQAETALMLMLPYLFTKREQAVLALEGVRLRRTSRQTGVHGNPLTDKVREHLTMIQEQITSLKKVS